ncbi:hypothetical protein TRFO_22871 [Tritrichomonas foetus]|uniref:Uncharacterized protein n=1 Tax=Tritrichomonas foetus TaxID=1144522 RepID=A0A1J4KC79_9EUKA|nr:hypothetical protein TRFO_22871 [Tritrichomonas foetus]|eukprot:OHT08536.1 hypothetical protein TRFO_22871 [Tritrichomonas foetus]
MIYNFGALDSDDENTSDEDVPSQDLSSEDKKRAEIQRLEQLRDQKRKELLPLTKNANTQDSEHQLQVKELQKQILKLSKEADEQRKTASQLEIQLKKMPVNPQQQEQIKHGPNEVQNEMIRNLRLETDSLKTEIQKAKRVISQEGGCKNRALHIKKLKSQIEDLPKESAPSESLEYSPPKTGQSQSSGIDVQTLRTQIADLSNEKESLRLKLRGLKSRVSVLEKDPLKARVRKNLKISETNDARIEKLRPKKIAMPTQKKFRGHVAQQSRLQVVILGLNAELIERNKELNLNKVEPGEPGICKEIERLQKRLHLLESSLSCTI